MPQHLMFVNPDLEKRFRSLCESDHEIGGYLFTTGATVRGLNRTRIKSLLNLTRWPSVYFITSWVILPNEAKHPDRQWNTSLNRPAMERMAQQTAYSLGAAWEYHFHTHPGWTNKPSDPDILFWLEHCNRLESKKRKLAEGVIVSSKGFRFNSYAIDLDRATNRYTLNTGFLLSWKDRDLIDYRREVFGK